MEKDMTKGRPLPVILKFMLPLIIGNIFQQLYNMADTIIVGRYVGADALAAVGSTGTIMFLTVGFSQGITAGFSVLTAQRFGAKDTEGVKISVANGILLSLIFTVIISSLSLLGMRPLLKLMNTPDNIFQDAYTYIMIISAGIIATIFYNLFSSYLRAVGNSKIPLVFLVFSAALNVILDLVLIINFKMGVAGAALATIISQYSVWSTSIYVCLLLPQTEDIGGFTARRAVTSWLWEFLWHCSLQLQLPVPWSCSLPSIFSVPLPLPLLRQPARYRIW